MSGDDKIFKLQIVCEGAAFEDDCQAEIARMLRVVAERLERGEPCDYYRNIPDINGNSVGAYALKERRAH
jgi:hypothetical protein